jgi:TetR/AcrR family fatty acid metabolism transcriptional regulator
MPKPDPIQDQLAAARHAQILEAAVKVFSEKGFHSATIKDVAKEAGVADGTIYNYFTNKTALLIAILDRLNETARRDSDFSKVVDESISIEEWSTSYIKHRYEVMGPEVFDVFRAILPELLVNRQLGQMYLQQVAEPTYALSEQHFKRWIEQGLIGEIDASLVLRIVSGTFLGVLLLRLMDEPIVQERWNEVPEMITQIILYGLVGRKNHEQRDPDEQVGEPDQHANRSAKGEHHQP